MGGARESGDRAELGGRIVYVCVAAVKGASAIRRCCRLRKGRVSPKMRMSKEGRRQDRAGLENHICVAAVRGAGAVGWCCRLRKGRVFPELVGSKEGRRQGKRWA